MPFVDINGAHVYYESAGVGEAVVFLHAGVADRRLWDGQVEPFARHYRVIRYDLRGFGQTTAPAMPYSLVEDLRALLDQLGVERAALVGCSMGGTLALDFALTYPDRVSALALVCATPGGFELKGAPPPLILELIAAQQAGDLEKMAALAVEIWAVGDQRSPDQVDPHVRDLVYEMSLIGFRNQAAGLGEHQTITPPAVERLGDVHIPALIVVGELDAPAIHEAGRLMAGGIAGARQVVMPDAAHLPSLEHPDEFNRILTEFFDAALKQ